MTAETLNRYTCKDLAQMAKSNGVDGWHSMRKDQLVRALMRMARRKASHGGRAVKAARRRSSPVPAVSGRRKSTTLRAVRAQATGKVAAKSPLAKQLVTKRPMAQQKAPHANGAQPKVQQARAEEPEPQAKPKDPAVAKRLLEARSRVDRFKNLAGSLGNGRSNGYVRDRLVVMVRGPFWLHAYWELTRQGVERAQAAMGQEWHSARPVLRVLHVPSSGTTSSAEALVRDIEIHGGVNNWYVDVNDPPKSYRLDIGYLAPSGRFFVLARSNVVSTPKAGSSDAIDENWTEVAEDFEKIYAMSGGYAPEGPNPDLQELFEERLRRPMGSPLVTQYGAGAGGLLPRKREFTFEVDAELIVYGSTHPSAHVTLQGEPVKLRPDGTFTVRFSLPNCRQVIPAVACSRDGLEQRTVVLAIERNTKTMEPLIRDGNE